MFETLMTSVAGTKLPVDEVGAQKAAFEKSGLGALYCDWIAG